MEIVKTAKDIIINLIDNKAISGEEAMILIENLKTESITYDWRTYSTATTNMNNEKTELNDQSVTKADCPYITYTSTSSNNIENKKITPRTIIARLIDINAITGEDAITLINGINLDGKTETTSPWWTNPLPTNIKPLSDGPYVGEPAKPWEQVQTSDNDYDPCEHCNNNPKNNPHATGVCSCALPYLVGKKRVIY